MKKIKVLIVDDSPLIQELLTAILRTDSKIHVVGCATDPYEARELIKQYHPDVITLDVEMPKMNGITFLKNLMRLRPMPVLMISTLTAEGSQITMQALELGAIDFIQKPENIQAVMDDFRQETLEKLKITASVPKEKLLQFQRRLANEEKVKTRPIEIHKARALDVPAQPSDRIIAIGGSTGGLEALRCLLENTRFTGNESIVVALHLPAGFTASYAKRLNQNLSLNVKEAEDAERILPGHVYIAPGGRHLQIKRRAVGYQCMLNDQDPVNRHRPSVDVLFESVANQAKQNAMGIILTGMGKDGAIGLLKMAQMGAETYAQDEASSVVWGMPGAAVKIEAVPLGNVKNLSKMSGIIPLFCKN